MQNLDARVLLSCSCCCSSLEFETLIVLTYRLNDFNCHWTTEVIYNRIMLKNKNDFKEKKKSKNFYISVEPLECNFHYNLSTLLSHFYFISFFVSWIVHAFDNAWKRFTISMIFSQISSSLIYLFLISQHLEFSHF